MLVIVLRMPKNSMVMVALMCLWVFQWVVHGLPMVVIWYSYGSPRGWESYGSPMGVLWESYGSPTGVLWESYGSPRNSPEPPSPRPEP